VLVQQVRAVFRLIQIRAMAQRERPPVAPSEGVLPIRDRPSSSMSDRPAVKPREKK
jgi:hypothetical protein